MSSLCGRVGVIKICELLEQVNPYLYRQIEISMYVACRNLYAYSQQFVCLLTNLNDYLCIVSITEMSVSVRSRKAWVQLFSVLGWECAAKDAFSAGEL